MDKISPFKISKNKYSLRKKLIISYIVFFLIILSSFLYLRIAYQYSSRIFQDFLKENQELYSLHKNLQSLLFYSETYISNGSPDNLTKFNNSILKIKILLNKKPGKYEELYNICTDIINQAEETINLSYPEYLQSHNFLSDNIELCQKYINNLIIENNNSLFNKNQIINSYISNIEKNASLLSVITALSLLFFLIYFSINISKPLNKIMENAWQLSSGNFNIDPIKVNTQDELKTIADVFNQMVYDIKKLIKELETKIDIERELQKEKVKNLKINNLLREAEIKQLQAHINPHFLYNTLNTITQVAILEEAEQTGNLIKNIARLLRYNLKQGDKLVKLEDEIKHINLYCEIMKIRFNDKLRFKLSFPEKNKDIYIPGMLLQPLIENSLIHGLHNNNKKIGIIVIKIFLSSDYLKIIVIDNGKGLSRKKIDSILSNNNTSISGLINIRERLRLLYQKDNLLKIHSIPGFYTKTIIKIPLNREEK